MADYATRLVVPDSTVPGTRAWAETVAANARQYAGFTEKDVRPLVERYRQLVKHEAWELWYPGQLGARDRFFAEVLGYKDEFLETMSRGVEILDGLGYQGRIPRQVAIQAAEERDKANQRPVGANQHSEAVNNIHTLRPEGTTRAAALRRLRKEADKGNPGITELRARVLAGEISPHAAMVQAGIRPKTISVPVTRPEAVARSLLKYMSADDIAKLIAVLLGKDG